MAHGTAQANFGLGNASDSLLATNLLDDDFIDIDAADVDIADAGSYTAETTVEAALQELYSYKPVWSTLTADSADVNNSEVLVASGLSVTLPVAGTYKIDCVLPYTTAAAADISLKFGGTATVTATVGTSDLWIVNRNGDADAATRPTLIPTSWTTEFEVATDQALAAVEPLVITGKLVATVAGTITLSFCQGTADVSNTHIDSGAFLKAQRVA